MIRNYFLTSIRALRRHAGFTIINLVGLSISMAVGLLMILFIREQATQDGFHEKSDRIFHVYSDFKSSGNANKDLYGSSPGNLSELIATEIPGVEAAIKLYNNFRGTVSYQGTGLPIRGFYADPSFFEVLSFGLSAGDVSTALSAPNSVVLSPGTAVKFFGDTDPLGEVLTLEGQGEFTVTGILERDNYPTHFPLTAIASYSTLKSDPATIEMLDNWTRSIYRAHTYILLEPGARPSDVQKGIDALIEPYFGAREGNVLHALTMRPLTSINLGAMMGNQLGTALPAGVAYFLLGLAFIILLTACFNYVGLTVSRALKRAREVGVRKLFGARRYQVFLQFLVEALIVSTVSMLGAIVLLAWLVPAFNGMMFVVQTGTSLTVDFAADPGLYGILALFTVIIAIAAGVYPAFYLSKFKPARAVKGSGDLSGAGGSRMRKSLVVVQFSLSIIFIVITTTMFRQASFMVNADYGFEQKNIVNVQLFSVPFENFRNELSKSSNIEMVSGTNPLPAMGSRSDRWLRTPGMDDPIKGYAYSIDENFVGNLGLTILAGRNVSPDIASDRDRTVLVNEQFLARLDLGSPQEAIGGVFIVGDSTEMQIAGVLKNYQADVISIDTTPNFLRYNPDGLSWANVRIVPGRNAEAEEDIRAAWTKMGHARAIEFEEFESQLANNFMNLLVKDVLNLVGFIAILALIIASLGLLGIATFNVERRTKEISIRKVLGASVADVIRLLTREFILLMTISLVISVPLAWLISNLWLQEFANRIDLGVGIFVFGVGSIMTIALLIISSQTMRAALENPVDNLHID